MDKNLDSVESPEKAINWSKELVHLLHLGGSNGRGKNSLRLCCGKRAWCQWKQWLSQNWNCKQPYLPLDWKTKLFGHLLTVNQVFTWTDSTTFLQRINSNESNQSLLQTPFAKFWSIPALTNGTTSQLRIIQLKLERVDCSLKFCN